ncbi:type II toxin-antitoxin system RelE/ParE family toxin [soil metagenome]
MKPVDWIASSRKDLRGFPKAVREVVGEALFFAQNGHKHPTAKPLKGFGGTTVLEVVESHDGDAYRAVYTVRFEEAVYVLHCFQKKSKRGISTPQADIELIERRLRVAQERHDVWLDRE